MRHSLYDEDFVIWTEEQAALLRSGKFSELDIDHIIEEIEDMGREQKTAIRSLIRQIISHLLKLNFSPATDPRSKWGDEISEFRAQAQDRIQDTPSLKSYADALFQQAWPLARKTAEKSFQLYGEKINMPIACPYTLEQVLDPDFFPEPVNRPLT